MKRLLLWISLIRIAPPSMFPERNISLAYHYSLTQTCLLIKALWSERSCFNSPDIIETGTTHNVDQHFIHKAIRVVMTPEENYVDNYLLNIHNSPKKGGWWLKNCCIAALLYTAFTAASSKNTVSLFPIQIYYKLHILNIAWIHFLKKCPILKTF